METAIKIIATIALAFTLAVFGIASIATQNSEETKKTTRVTLVVCAVAQALGIIVIWCG